jgi:pimeloyl-ACP methyl ester carboxylesterase
MLNARCSMLNAFVVAALLYLIGPGESAVAQTRRVWEPVHNVVLVHGAFTDGSSWSDVIRILQGAGFRATAVQIPLTSLADDVVATKRVLAQQDGPTVLVGHSYGGVVISQAGTDPKVVSLVYIAALAPDIGEDYIQLAKAYPPAPGESSIKEINGYIELDDTGFVTNYAQDLNPIRSRVLAAVQTPAVAGLLTQKTSLAAWKIKPTWYAISSLDRMLAPELQRYLAQRMNARKIVEIKTSHASPITKPDDVAKLIETAATALR